MSLLSTHSSSASTKASEQQGRATQSTSADILFEFDRKTTTTQKAFLANSKNKARLNDKLTTELHGAIVLVKQAPADGADLNTERKEASRCRWH